MSDQESIVYGCIKNYVDNGSNSVDGINVIGSLGSNRREANRQALLSLPDLDEWPYLCQEMFSIPRVKAERDQYQTHVVHFGASYRAVEYEWNLWIKKFEGLLQQMYWVSAVVHLETELTGLHTFTWNAGGVEHTPGKTLEQCQREWTLENSVM